MRRPSVSEQWLGQETGHNSEALSLIHFLLDQSQLQSEWLNALSSDQTLSPPRRIRQRALQFAREWKLPD